MALAPVGADQALNITVTIEAGAATSNQIGYPCLIYDDTGDRFTIYANTAAIDAAETAGTLTSAAAAALRTGFAQLAPVPAGVVAIRYDSTAGSPETPIIGLEDAISDGLDVGGVVLLSGTETAQETLAGWFAADQQRIGRYLFFVQSNDTGLYGGSKPASLDACELSNVRMFYASDDTRYVAFAALCRACAKPLVGAATGNVQTNPSPAGAFPNIRGVTAETGLTAANISNLTTNDVGFLQPFDHGADSTENNISGSPNMYDGSDFATAVSAIFASRQIRAVLGALWQRYADAGASIPANSVGIAICESEVVPVLDEMAAAGHFTLTDPDYPGGYTIVGSIITVSGNQRVQLAITLATPGGIAGITVPVVASEVS